MVHSLRMDFGDSDNTYGGDIWEIPLKPPPQSLIQENGVAPSISAIDTPPPPPIKCLQEASHGAVFKLIILRDSFHLVGYCFMDDSKIIQVSPSPDNTPEEMVKLPQKVLNTFERAAKVTGGKVSAEKTKWYIMDFKWDQ